MAGSTIPIRVRVRVRGGSFHYFPQYRLLFTHYQLTIHSLFAPCSLTTRSLSARYSLTIRSLFTLYPPAVCSLPTQHPLTTKLTVQFRYSMFALSTGFSLTICYRCCNISACRYCDIHYWLTIQPPLASGFALLTIHSLIASGHTDRLRRASCRGRIQYCTLSTEHSDWEQ